MRPLIISWFASRPRGHIQPFQTQSEQLDVSVPHRGVGHGTLPIFLETGKGTGRIMMCNGLNSTIYSVYNQCRHWESGTTDMRADLATQPAWKPLHCSYCVIQLQPLHRHLLEGMRLRHWPCQWINRTNWSEAHVQKIYLWINGNRSRIARVHYRSTSALGNVPHHPRKYLQGLPRWYQTPEILITSSIQNYHF